MGHFFHEIWRTYRALFVIFVAILSPTKNINLAQKKGVLRADSHTENVDSRVARLCPALPGFEVQESADPSLFLTRRSSG